MFTRYFSSHVAFVLLIAAIWACGSSSSSKPSDTDKANKLVDEGNAAVDQMKTFVHEAEAKRDEMMRTDLRRLADARARAAEAIAAYDQATAKCKEAGSKFDEASRLNVADKFKQYLILKTKEFTKRVELIQVARDTPQALIESTNRSSFQNRVASNKSKFDQLLKEVEDLSALADKMYRDNPDLFKKS